MIISVANQKGGVGKTVTSFLLANILADMGCNTLAIDLDQTNLTDYFHVEPDTTIFDVLAKNVPISRAEVIIRDNLKLIPSDVRTAGLDRVLSDKIRKDNVLSKALSKDTYQDTYKYIIIDCPPALDSRMVNALTASDYCLVAVFTEPHSLKAVPFMLDLIRDIQENTNANLKYRFVATRHDRVPNVTRDTLEALQKRYGDLVLKTIIHKDVKMQEQALRESIPLSRAVEEYRELAREVSAL